MKVKYTFSTTLGRAAFVRGILDELLTVVIL